MPGALDGIRVLEVGGELVGAAYATKLLADLGADVVKIEPPAGDPTRRRGPFAGGAPHPERSGLFLYLNTNKRGVALDLQAAARPRRVRPSGGRRRSAGARRPSDRDGGARPRLGSASTPSTRRW